MALSGTQWQSGSLTCLTERISSPSMWRRVSPMARPAAAAALPAATALTTAPRPISLRART